MVFLAALMVMLGKYSRQEDIVVGSPISGRTHKDTESMLGMFVNTLAMRGRPEGEKTFAEFLGEIKKLSLNAYENQEYPFEELVEAVDVQRDMSRNPLFDVLMALQNVEDTEVSISDNTFEAGEQPESAAKFDLSFDIQPFNNSYEIALQYCTKLFEKETAQGILVHLTETLEKVTRYPEKQIKDIEIATEKEKAQILGEFNDTAAEYPKDKTIVELFEEQVGKTPNNTALVFEDESLTYAELNAKANCLARKLRELGVKPDDFVAIIADRSIEMIVAIYGVLKSGGAYLPIDPTYPTDRISFMLEDSKPKAVLTYTAESLNISDEIPVIDLGNKSVYDGSSENPEHVNTSKNLAYCIYTSGTTGKPKGVMCHNRGLINRILWMDSRYPLEVNDAIMQKTTFTFDVSVWEMFWWGLKGAKL